MATEALLPGFVMFGLYGALTGLHYAFERLERSENRRGHIRRTGQDACTHYNNRRDKRLRRWFSADELNVPRDPASLARPSWYSQWWYSRDLPTNTFPDK